ESTAGGDDRLKPSVISLRAQLADLFHLDDQAGHHDTVGQDEFEKIADDDQQSRHDQGYSAEEADADLTLGDDDQQDARSANGFRKPVALVLDDDADNA